MARERVTNQFILPTDETSAGRLRNSFPCVLGNETLTQFRSCMYQLCDKFEITKIRIIILRVENHKKMAN